MKVLIGGGTGFIGRHLTKLLSQRGHNFIIISQTPDDNTITWNDLQRDGLPSGCDAVVNLAGKNLMSFERWNEAFKSTLLCSRVDTTKQLVNAINNAPYKPRAFVAASAVGYYRPDPVIEYTEDMKVEPFDYLSELTRKWEESAKLPENSPTRSICLRIGGPIGSGKQWFPWIHVDDVAGIILHAIENDDVTGVVNAVAPQHLTNGQVMKAVAKAMWRPALIPLPGCLLKAVFGEDRATAMLDGQKVVPKKALEYGYKFRYPTIDVATKEFARMFPMV